SLKNRCFIGVAACHRILGRDRGGIVLRGERRKGGIGFVIDHRRRRCAAAMTSAAATAIMASVDIVVCQVWTNESLRAPNELAAGSKVGRIDGKVPRGVSPIKEPSLGRRPKFSR